MSTLPFPDDVRTRPDHCATFSDTVLIALDDALPRRCRLLDPFAGTGKIHRLDRDSWGVELEPEWATMHPRTLVGDATVLPFTDASFDAVATSPTYGNRMADLYDGRDGTRRYTYRLSLGRPLSPGSAAGLQWGRAYRDLHVRAWTEARRVLRPGGLMLVNVADHIRKGQVQQVTDWHRRVLASIGFDVREVRAIPTPKMRYGQNGGARTVGESLIVGVRAS